MAQIDLNDADQQIKEVLQDGRNTPSNLASELGYTREYVSQRLKRLREHNLVERVGRGLYEWDGDDIVESDSSNDAFEGETAGERLQNTRDKRGDEDAVPPDSTLESGDRADIEAKRETYEGLEEVAESEEGSEPSDISPKVWGVIEDIAEGWDDDDRLANRKQAAAEVLQHANETGEPVGKSSKIVEEVREKYPVVGQNEETYWRKNIRDVLSEVGDYSRGSHKYTVETLETTGENA